MGHIQLSRDADLLVVAPATADILARMAAGLANDLAATVLLATDKRVLVAPAMNVRMWTHPATVANVETLRKRGITFIGPNDGAMACNEHGPGRMSEPHEIADAIEGMLTGTQAAAERPLAGKRALVTSGPTREAIDPVRYISNHSSGKQGHAIAEALRQQGAETILVTGPVALPDPATRQRRMLIATRQELDGVRRHVVEAEADEAEGDPVDRLVRARRDVGRGDLGIAGVEVGGEGWVEDVVPEEAIGGGLGIAEEVVTTLMGLPAAG